MPCPADGVLYVQIFPSHNPTGYRWRRNCPHRWREPRGIRGYFCYTQSRFVCLANCQDLCLSNFCLSGSFVFIWSPILFQREVACVTDSVSGCHLLLTGRWTQGISFTPSLLFFLFYVFPFSVVWWAPNNLSRCCFASLWLYLVMDWCAHYEVGCCWTDNFWYPVNHVHDGYKYQGESVVGRLCQTNTLQ